MAKSEIHGTILDHKLEPKPNVFVEAYHVAFTPPIILPFNYYLGMAKTNQHGKFEISFPSDAYGVIGLLRAPNISLRINDSYRTLYNSPVRCVVIQNVNNDLGDIIIPANFVYSDKISHVDWKDVIETYLPDITKIRDTGATYIQKSTTSDLSPFADGNREMSAGTGTDTSFTSNAANGGGTETHGFITPANVPNNNAWKSRTYTYELEIDAGDAGFDAQARLVRLDSSGNVQETGAFTSAQDCSVSRTFTPEAPAGGWGTSGSASARGDRFAVEILFTNNNTHGAHTVTVGLGTTANEMITPLTQDAGATFSKEELAGIIPEFMEFMESQKYFKEDEVKEPPIGFRGMIVPKRPKVTAHRPHHIPWYEEWSDIYD